MFCGGRFRCGTRRSPTAEIEVVGLDVAIEPQNPHEWPVSVPLLVEPLPLGLQHSKNAPGASVPIFDEDDLYTVGLDQAELEGSIEDSVIL